MGKDDNNNKKQEPQDNAAATASATALNALEDAATAGALAAAGAPVSAIVKCKDYDHVFVTSRCAGSSYSVKSEDSDIDSDSDSNSNSDSDSESDSEEESCTDDDENQGFFQKFWPSEVSSRQIPRSVSFVTDDDSQETNKEEELELNENYEDMYYTDEDDQKSQHTHNTNTNVGGTVIGAMTDIGGVFFRKKEKPKDARDLRMLDSDISNSSDEDDEDDS